MRNKNRLTPPRDITRPECTRSPAPQRPGDHVPPADGTWYRIENAGATEADIYLYDEIGGWGVYADEFVEALGEVTSSKITLHVNSPGGSVWEAMTIMSAIAGHSATVTAKIEGVAASAASFLVQGADKVLIGKQAQMMIHDASTIAYGNAADMLEVADLLNRMSGDIASVYADASGTPASVWRDRMRATTWYTGQEAVDAGLVDETFDAVKPRESAEDALPVPEPVNTDNPVSTPPVEPAGDADEWLPTLTASEASSAVSEAADEWVVMPPEDFRAIVSAIAEDMPAEPARTPDAQKEDEGDEEWFVEPVAVTNAVREAIRA
jgi:ATP-dependent protease ClpP protease subunit